MANYCIFRTKKLKTDGNVGGSISHALRTRETLNADAEKTPENWYNWKGSPEEAQQRAMAKYRSLLPDKVRKNGVRAVELLMTASPEIMKSKTKKEQGAYLNDCILWAEDVFGKQNIFLKSAQFDETTPHISIFLVPIDPNGKFIRQYYTELNTLDKAITPPKKKMLESQEEYQARYKQQIAPLVKEAGQIRRIKQQNEQHKKIQSEALDKQKRAYESQITGLQEDLERKTKEILNLKKRLDTWRESPAEELRAIADDYDKTKSKNWKQFEKKRQIKEREFARS